MAASLIAQEHIALLNGFPAFFDAVQKSYSEYEDRLKVATRNIEISSQELTTSYANVENLNISMNAMLDSLGNGLLFFNSEGICSSVYSKACLTLLEVDPSHKHLTDILNFSDDERRNLETWLPIVFSGNVALDFNDMKKLLPGEIRNTKNHVIKLDYRPMYLHEDSLTGILLIATDITQEIEAERKMARIQMEAHKIQQIARGRNGFHRFLCDIYNFVNMTKELDANDILMEDRNAFLRQLHTFKGYASTFGLQVLSEKLHDTEADIRSAPDNRLALCLQERMGEIEDHLELEKEFARDLFGPGFMTQGRVLTVEMPKVQEFIGLLSDVVKNREERSLLMRALTKNILSIPIFNAFLSFERELARIAEHQGKAIPECHMEGENVPIVFSEYEDFFNVLIHLARNISDHGIEMPDERVHKGKKREGQITIRMEHSKRDFLKISIKDDGQGIDPGKIRHKLKKERGIDLAGKSDEEALQYIFEPDFSLLKETSMISGRGMGMNAIKDIVDQMGGSVKVSSGGPDAQGTSFIFELPYKM